MEYSFIDLNEEWTDLMTKALNDEPRDFTRLREIARSVNDGLDCGINCDGTDEELVKSVRNYFRRLLEEDDQRWRKKMQEEEMQNAQNNDGTD